MEDEEKQKLIELKHKVLQKRISDILDMLKLIDKLMACSKDIKSIEIISEQYEKMYHALLQSEEYDKYQEIEDTIIAKISKIESNLDRYIYRLAKNYSKYLESIENSENYKNFHNLDIEIERIQVLKSLLPKCSSYHSESYQNDLKQKILELKFKILVRRQIEQMVYENGGMQSRLIQYEDLDEAMYFTKLVYNMMKTVKEEDEVLQVAISRVMEDNILANHLVFKLLEKDIPKNPQKYMGLLEAPIFNPHFCTIAKDPYSEKILYTKNLERSKVNLGLLLGVLGEIIDKENRTIVECSSIYERFGFECKPIILNEGQEIVRQVFEKVKDNIKPKERDTSRTQGKYALLYITAYNYDFKPKEVAFIPKAKLRQEWEMREIVYAERFQNYFFTNQSLDLYDMKHQLGLLEKMYGYIRKDPKSWIIKPIEEMSLTFKGTKVLESHECLSNHYGSRWETITHVKRDYKTLWNSYKLDFKELGVRAKQIGVPDWSYESYSDRSGDWDGEHWYRGRSGYWNTRRSYIDRRKEDRFSFRACINLDDIADLPINLEKIYILTEKEMREVHRLEEKEEQRQ